MTQFPTNPEELDATLGRMQGNGAPPSAMQSVLDEYRNRERSNSLQFGKQNTINGNNPDYDPANPNTQAPEEKGFIRKTLEKLPTVGETVGELPVASGVKESLAEASETVGRQVDKGQPIRAVGSTIGGAVQSFLSPVFDVAATALDPTGQIREGLSTPEAQETIASGIESLGKIPGISNLVEGYQQMTPEEQQALGDDVNSLLGFLDLAGVTAIARKPIQKGIKAGFEAVSDLAARSAEAAPKIIKKTGEVIASPVTGTKKVVREATGKAARERQIAVAEETRATFKGAEAKKVQFEEAKVRKKSSESELLKEKGKVETVTGEKATPDFSKTKFANKRVQKEVSDTFLNNTDEVIDKGDLANNALKLSEMTPTGGQSQFAASKVRKYVLDNTSPKFAKLNDEFADTSRAISILNDNIKFKTAINIQDLTPKLRGEVSKIKGLTFKEAEKAKFDLLNKLRKEKTAIGKSMDAEIKNLSGQTVDGAKFRTGLEDTLSEQGVTISREPITKLNKKELDEIIKNNPDDPRVQQLIQDRKIVEAGKPSKIAASLQGKIIKDGNPDLAKIKELILQIEKTPEGDLLRQILPEDLIKEITKNRIITKKNAIKLGGLILGGKILEKASGFDVPFL